MGFKEVKDGKQAPQTWDLTELERILFFDSIEETRQFCEYFDVPIQSSPQGNDVADLTRYEYPRDLAGSKCNVVVHDMPPEFNSKDLNKLFSPHGTISSCRVVMDHMGVFLC
jgi:hypothetical protein